TGGGLLRQNRNGYRGQRNRLSTLAVLCRCGWPVHRCRSDTQLTVAAGPVRRRCQRACAGRDATSGAWDLENCSYAFSALIASAHAPSPRDSPLPPHDVPDIRNPVAELTNP